MELDEMKQAWQALDRQLERQHALNWRIWRDGQAERLRRGLRPLVWGQSMLIVLGIAIASWGVSFWSSHLGIWQAMACGIAMQAFGTLAFIFPARVLWLVRAVDYAAPVLQIQQRIARLRAWRVKVEAPVFAVLGSVIWIPAMLMLAQYAMDRAGVNLWGGMKGAVSWLLLCAAGSLAVVALAYVLLRWFGRRRWLEDNFAGSAVRKAEAMLEEIARFEREA
ncbi:hypothetical protein [Frateuria terrea]|uniref:Serine/threonine protein kinase n=1 Tax=Frateuria terrea TaxID=529704 RepID=A0A1H6QS28_9GAMM|nr:hypothetical protein [Frateuria terrea]SEI42987.1 hypothetical protein SAMN04487997_0605 [Frateuria terrea]SFP08299.1 hypothetical protein SAMN02927913_0521 [Frateuria terrea]